MTTAPELSCYTAALVSYLEPDRPHAGAELADAVGLSVRTDPTEGTLAFTHHDRVDVDGEGLGLAYRGAGSWDAAREALLAESRRRGRVLAVGNTRHLPWSPSYGGGETPHWLLVTRADDGQWAVRDAFEALTPHGAHAPWEGLVSDAGLRALLTPPTALTPEAANRDRYALGREVPLPAADGYRWLERAAVEDGPGGAGAGHWVHGTVAVLRHITDRLCRDAVALAAHADDLWTAARHQRHRLAAGRDARRADAEAVRRAAAAWAELPRAVRFSVASAERGRPRPAVVQKAFAELVDAVEELETKDGPHED
ncbi:hypothetical protein ABTY98_27010 [Streptomyces sp. NPDC096040]|uniref:hypothetical protein n=1 Tax=Streptomyces sp. NPDC096040 TaxID=3155541 RepID=UPI0033299756